MTPEAAETILTLINAAWPSPPMSPETVAIYVEGMSDLRAAETYAAVKALVGTEDFRPAVARIRRAVLERSVVLPSLSEAVAQAEELSAWHRALRVPQGAGEYPPRPITHPLVEEALTAAGDDFIAGVFTARFNEIRAREERNLLVLQSLGSSSTKELG